MLSLRFTRTASLPKLRLLLVRQSVGGDASWGAPQGGVISPLLSNLYMSRAMKETTGSGWKRLFAPCPAQAPGKSDALLLQNFHSAEMAV
jgi:hypothetical protein